MRSALVALVLAGLAIASPAQASTTIVPDNFATIQAAIDANADTVYVKAGTYEETVTLTHSVYLSWYDGAFYSGAPVVRRIQSASYGHWVTVVGLHFLGGASITGSTVVVEKCRADSGLTCGGMGGLRVMGCTVFGKLEASATQCQVLMNTVVGGTLQTTGQGGSPAQSNYVSGPATVGLVAGADVSVTHNLVRNCVDGIHAGCTSYYVERNTVEDCSGDGISSDCSGYGQWPSWISWNVVRRCGGVGVRARGGSTRASGNVVDSTGGAGMVLSVTTDRMDSNYVTRAGGTGIQALAIVGHVRGNTVLRSAGDGISITYSHGPVDHNVTGHNRGRGLVVGSDVSNLSLRSNTSYDNGSYGYDVVSLAGGVDSVANNIALGNSAGLNFSGGGSALLACNDWYGNSSGATSGVSPGATDFSEHPQFCNLPADVVTLAATSPALNRAGCGLVGALGQGCATPMVVVYESETGGASLRAYPQPNHGVVRFAWRPVSEPVRLEVYDAQGALRLTRDVSAGAQEYALGTDSGGRVLPAGIYFARLHGATGELGTCRVVVLN